jgi:hypothetical protein
MREQQKLLHWILTTTPTARYAQSVHIQRIRAVPLYAVLALEVATVMQRCEHGGKTALGAQSATIKIKIGKRFALHVPKGGTRKKQRPNNPCIHIQGHTRNAKGAPWEGMVTKWQVLGH